MNLVIKQHLTDIEQMLKNQALTPKQHFTICNKLQRLEEYINEQVKE